MNVTYFGALVAGFLSFLSPCVLPLVPPYLCFLGGVTLEQIAGETRPPARTVARRRRPVVDRFRARLYHRVRGARRVRLGVMSRPAPDRDYAAGSSKIAGVIIIIAGLHFLGVFKLPLLHREARYHRTRPVGLLGAYVIGLAFAFGWTPCIGPVLAAILPSRPGRIPCARASACCWSIR